MAGLYQGWNRLGTYAKVLNTLADLVQTLLHAAESTSHTSHKLLQLALRDAGIRVIARNHVSTNRSQ